MTQAKSTLRPRRRKDSDVPADLAAWFAGEPRPEGKSSIPWSALIFPDYALLPERWQAWKAEHPDEVRPPAGFEWLDDPDSARHPPERLLNQARALVMRRCR